MKYTVMTVVLLTILGGCGKTEDLFKQGDAGQTRLYVHNELEGFFRSLSSLRIRETGAPAYEDDLLGSISLIGDEFFKTIITDCPSSIDIRIEVNNGADPVEEVFEYIGLPVKCGEDYKFVIFEPTPPTTPYTSEGCMQTSSSASRAEDARIQTACGVGVEE